VPGGIESLQLFHELRLFLGGGVRNFRLQFVYAKHQYGVFPVKQSLGNKMNQFVSFLDYDGKLRVYLAELRQVIGR
jgi:hypothetical protein